MSETLRSGVVYTLEDLIARQDKPTEEMVQGLSEARDMIQDNHLVQILGLNVLDSVLLHTFVAEKVIKTRLYDLDWITHSPEFLTESKQTARDESKRVNLQTSLSRIGIERDEIVDQSYADPVSRIRVRNLELCVNDLVARGSEFIIPKKGDPYTDINISVELLDNWAERWANKFVKRGHARQKFLRYKQVQSSPRA